MDIDRSKENIQPLRGGRNQQQLGAALSAQTHADAQRTLQLQRQEHEALVESYDGPDPLEPWFNYIQWVEQSFPKRGHEGQIDKLIKECLARFESDERYSQDRRFLRLWIKYIDYSNAPLELYQLLYNRNVGTECAELYRAWACYCEEANDHAKAEQIYNLGMQRGAQPRDELEQAHASFQIWFAQRVLHDDSPTKRKAASALAETRLALTSLRTVKRRNTAAAPSQRTGEYVGDFAPGTVRQRFDAAERRPRSNVQVHVYDENPSTSALPVVAEVRDDRGAAASLLQSVDPVENQKEVGIWTNGSTARSEKGIIAKKPAPLAFTLYEDNNSATDDQASGFDDRIPLCVPDPPDPNKISMYNKKEVYKETENGLVEFSPEEIRARLYVEVFKNRRKTTDSPDVERIPESEVRFDDGDEFNLERVIAQSNSLLMNADGPAAADDFDYGACVGDEAAALPIVCIPSSSDDRVYRSEEPKKNIMADFNRSLMANLMEDSMTVNTKEALRELNLFGGNDTVPTIPRMEPVKFDIREDHSLTMAAVRAKSVEAPGPAPFRDLGGENQKLALEPSGLTNNLDDFELDEFSTQVFTFNVPMSSTPYSNNFKKSQATKPCVKNFSLADCVAETPNADRVGADELYPIMETTQEYRSGSSSSGSNFVTRNGAYAYPARETLDVIDERSQDVNFNRGDGHYQRYIDPSARKVQQTPAGYSTVVDDAGVQPTGSQAASFHGSDHSYHKMSAYSNQPNGSYQNPTVPYQNVEYPQNLNYQTPQHRGEQLAYDYDARHAMQTHHSATAFQSPQRALPEFQNPQRSHVQQSYQSPQAVAYQNGQQEYMQNGYAVQQQRTYQATPVHAYPAYQSPVRQQQTYQNYQNASVRSATSYSAVPQYQTPNYVHNAQPSYQSQQQHQAYPSQSAAAPSYQHPQQYSVDATRQQAYYANRSYEARAYQGSETSQHNGSYEAQAQYGYARQYPADQARHGTPTVVQRQHAYQSPTSKLRSVRHEAPHSSRNAAEASPGFRFGFRPSLAQSLRSEPKADADAPKFNGGRSISQKMNKNLYVSSPEQAQMPPAFSGDDSLSRISDAQKDQFKRQLDFERRAEAHSEDSRDSSGKESRPPRSRKSASDSLRMDVDENSSDALASKTDLSNSHISTQDAVLPAEIDFPETIDPFNSDLCHALLHYVKFPNKNHYRNYYETKTIPKLQQGALLSFDRSKFAVEKQLGKGTFGSVFRALDRSNGEPVALKYQKPGHRWEYYICEEIKARITNPYILPGFMDIRAAYFGDHASLFVSELSAYGSLLDVANRIKTATTKCISEFIVMFLASEMLSIVHHLHKAGIVHADIKPDNFLVMKIPQTESRAPSLQLIDFGCAIDMTLFPEGTTFRKVISTDGFTCTEMRDGRPWTYQTDLYCLAGTVYVILMGNYMQTANRGGQWAIDKKWPRYMRSSIWDKVFGTLLNVPDCSAIPDLSELKETLDEFLRYEENTLTSQLRTFEHVLKCK